jgi:uncharacterized protein
MSFAPMRMFICKIASRCNLDCDYCYVYRHIDQSWRQQPIRMSLETAAQLGWRIREHACAHGLTAVDVVMHGGEPLLVGVDYLRQLCEIIRDKAFPVEVRFKMQTNGTLLDEEAFSFCIEWKLHIGLSMDGGRRANDAHRLDHQGQSSFDAVERALKLLSSEVGQNIWSGFLAVIDLNTDPIETYSYFKSFKPRSIEFLFPLGHHDLRPPGKLGLKTTPYADWLLKIFDVWYRERPQTTKIRRFRDVIAMLAGATSSSEEWGLQPTDFAVVETNGSIEAVDTLKTTYPGANHLGLNIIDHSFDQMFNAPLVLERQMGWSALCATCQNCELVRVCAGGYFPHRYSSKNGFQNPSIYCADLMKLIREIHAVVSEDVKQLRSTTHGQQVQPGLGV